MYLGYRRIAWVATLVAVFVGISLGSRAQSSLPVVPGGQGFGMSTRAAYGCGTSPAILRVTNLNDGGAGSLREALTASGPRVVIFETSGTIALGSDIDIVASCVTVAGQTAPSPGITLRGGGLNVFAYHVLIQHLRIRPGDGGPVQPQTAGHDSTIAYGAFGSHAARHRVRPCVLQLARRQERHRRGQQQPANINFWRCILSEALYYAQNVIVSEGQPSSLGMLIGESGGVSIIGNLFAHNFGSQPGDPAREPTVQFVNNVVYDWGKDTTDYPWATFFYVGGPVPGRRRSSVTSTSPALSPSPVTPALCRRRVVGRHEFPAVHERQRDRSDAAGRPSVRELLRLRPTASARLLCR